jgi:hypothetical protein
MDLRKVKEVRVVSSPYPEDEDFPWVYSRDAFVGWVDEVLLAGYKAGGRFPSFKKATEIAEGNGYGLQYVADTSRGKHRRKG